MNTILQRPLIWLIIIAFCAGGCTRIFENDADTQARKALQDLMAIQEQFHKENNRYARNLVEIDKYDLEYHKGIVYLEIESAGKDKYRAISLPAESTTARVFAYDTSRGGYYEMDEEEVAQYVLGALNYIRKEQREKAVFDYLYGGMLIFLVWFGLRLFSRQKESRTAWVWVPYFVCLIPLSLSVAALNHMDRDTFLSTELLTLMATGFGVSVVCLLIAGIGLTKIPEKSERNIMQGLAVCTILICLFTGFTLAQSYLTYSQPQGNRLYYK